jgi:hypothetical protein
LAKPGGHGVMVDARVEKALQQALELGEQGVQIAA